MLRKIFAKLRDTIAPSGKPAAAGHAATPASATQRTSTGRPPASQGPKLQGKPTTGYGSGKPQGKHQEKTHDKTREYRSNRDRVSTPRAGQTGGAG